MMLFISTISKEPMIMTDYVQALSYATTALNQTKISLTMCSATSLIFIISLVILMAYIYGIRRRIKMLESRLGVRSHR